MSLIQQRIRIDRGRVVGTVFTTAGALTAVLGLIAIPLGSGNYGLIGAIPQLGYGIFRLVDSRRERIAFEAAHGRDAGVQK